MQIPPIFATILTSVYDDGYAAAATQSFDANPHPRLAILKRFAWDAGHEKGMRDKIQDNLNLRSKRQ